MYEKMMQSSYTCGMADTVPLGSSEARGRSHRHFLELPHFGNAP